MSNMRRSVVGLNAKWAMSPHQHRSYRRYFNSSEFVSSNQNLEMQLLDINLAVLSLKVGVCNFGKTSNIKLALKE